MAVTPGLAQKPAAEPVKAEQPEEKDDGFEELWTYAVDYAKEHPREFAQAIAHFKTVQQRAVGSNYEMMAASEISTRFAVTGPSVRVPAACVSRPLLTSLV